MNKFYLRCQHCNNSISDFSEWFSNEQRCPKCGGKYSKVIYKDLICRLIKTFAKNNKYRKGMWRYFDVLPLNNEGNIISAGEGDVAIERWSFLEIFAYKYFGIKCYVYAHRHDNNNATGSFKDLAGSLVASVLFENNINRYVVASTGNIGVAFSRYISQHGGTLYAFIPDNSPLFKEAEIEIFGQKVYRVSGDYDETKKVAEDFAQQNKMLIAAGTFDPMRVEAKKTMAFEWFRQLPDFPSVYIQALSGGTGPLGIMKGCEELRKAKLIREFPRLILVQSDKCAPMAKAWKEAKAHGFIGDWAKNYPVYKNPSTKIPTLATGNPSAYPVIAMLVKKSLGEIIDFPEELVPDIVRVVACETAVRIGPAAAIAVGGFFASLRNGFIHNQDTIMINIGEGIRRDPEFMVNLNQGSIRIKSSNDCFLFSRDAYKESIWANIISYIIYTNNLK